MQERCLARGILPALKIIAECRAPRGNEASLLERAQEQEAENAAKSHVGKLKRKRRATASAVASHYKKKRGTDTVLGRYLPHILRKICS